MMQGRPSQPVNSQTLASFREYAPRLIEAMIVREFGTERLGGRKAEADMVAAGMGFVIKMLDAAMEIGDVTILEDQLVWAAERLPHDGVSSGDVLQRFENFEQVLKAMLEPEHAQAIVLYVQWMIDRQRDIMDHSQTGTERSNDRRSLL